ncbi:MAG: tol-pal system protein YbgF [Gammaproteobacteria bacterium]|nr:tol-pal system protein YbgF [Pseudomonadales bacterium]MCP5345975.1 tol-pal system protein YbgF [Pseudomonadales bacterium]
MKILYPAVLPALIRLSMVAGLGAVSVGASGQAGSNDAMVLLLEQNRNLQTEVQALRGLVEEQGYEIRRLQRESLDRYTDTDNRLRSLEQALANGTVPESLSGAGTGADLPTRALPADGGQTAAGGPVSQDDLSTASAATATPASPRGLITGAGTATDQGQEPVSTPDRQPRSSIATRSANSRPGLEPAVLTEQQLYQMAYDSAINSQFERAIAEFDQYLGIYPQGRFTTNAHYWKGQSYLYLSRYDEAIAEYEIILNQYPGDAKVPDAMYGQAVALEGMGDTQRARRLLQQIMRSYPNTGVANLADTRLRSLN